MFIPLIVETFEEPGVAADIEMPTATSPTAPVAPVYVVFSVPVHDFSYHASCFLLGPLPTVLSQFDVGSSSATILDPISEVAAFFTHFD